MDFKDYYEILGISPQADAKEIKKTYRRLTKKYHPDVNQGDKESEEKFKEINEAYQAISDPDKRSKYDQIRHQYQNWQKGGGRGSFDWASWQDPGRQQTGSRSMTPEEFQELFGDQGARVRFHNERTYNGFSDFFSAIFGGEQGFNFGGTNPFSEGRARSSPGKDVQGDLTITLQDAYFGAKKQVSIGQKRIEVTIPKGIKDLTQIRLAGQGETNSKGVNPGDLYIRIHVQPQGNFEGIGDDLKTTAEIDFYQALFGGEIRVKTISGEILITIPPKTQTGKTFRVKGKGMPLSGKLNQYGDLYVRVSIVIPENITEEEITKIKEIRKLSVTR